MLWPVTRLLYGCLGASKRLRRFSRQCQVLGGGAEPLTPDTYSNIPLHPTAVHALGTASRNAGGVSRHPNTRIDPELQAPPSYRPCTWHCLEKRRRRFEAPQHPYRRRVTGPSNIPLPPTGLKEPYPCYVIIYVQWHVQNKPLESLQVEKLHANSLQLRLQENQPQQLVG